MAIGKLCAALTLCLGLIVSDVASADDKTCSRAAKVAEHLMMARQRGVSLEDALEALSSYPASAHKFVRALVMDAYSVPRFNSPEYQQRAIGEFRDEAHLACLKVQ